MYHAATHGHNSVILLLFHDTESPLADSFNERLIDRWTIVSAIFLKVGPRTKRFPDRFLRYGLAPRDYSLLYGHSSLLVLLLIVENGFATKLTTIIL